MSLAAGARLGPYEIIGALGAGGMGAVYTARDTRLGRTVAIKVLHPGLAADPAFRARFDGEARVLSHIAHPNICAIHDIGEVDGSPYLVLEHLEGETLARRIARGPLPVEDARRIGVEICRALETAHRAGIVHRDLTPANVMLTKSGARLLDFGLARDATRTPAGDLATAVALTEAGTILGTTPYMSPEQLQGRPADTRSDIFALGAVLLEAFTGRRAFAGDSPMAIAAAIISTDAPVPSALNPTLPAALDAIVQGCLAREPDARWQSAHDVGRQLETLDRNPVSAGTRVTSRRTWVPWGVAVLAVVAAASAWIMSGSRLRPDPPTIAFHVALPAGTSQYTSVEGNSIALSPDGTQLAWIAEESTTRRVWLRPLADLESHPLAGSEDASGLFWSPDSRSLAFFARGMLQRLDLPAGAPVPVCPVQPGIGYTGAWGADGQILFAPIQGEAIYRVATSGGSPQKVIAANRAAGERRVGWPWFLSDGATFIYLLHLDGGASFLMLAAKDRAPQRISETFSEAQYVEPGYLVFSRNGALVAQRFDLAGARLVGDPVSLASHVQSFLASGWVAFSAAPNRTIAFASGRDHSYLAWIDGSGRETGRIGSPGNYETLNSSRDAGSVLASRQDDSGTYDVWSVDLTRGTETRVTAGPGTKISPFMTPDGRSMIYSRTTGGSPQLYRRDVSSGTDARLVPRESFQNATSMSRDGRVILYNERTDRGDWDVVMLPLDDTHTPTALEATSFSENDGQLSPDDRLFAFVSNETNRPEVYVAPFPAGTPKVRVSSNGGRTPRWRAGGHELLYIADDARLMRAVVSLDPTLRVGTPTPQFAAPPKIAWRTFVVLPDNRILAVIPETVGREQPMTVLTNVLLKR